MKLKNQMKVATFKRTQGFSLIELMVVIVILAAIAGLVAPQLLGRGEQAKRDLVKSDIQTIETALDLYRLDNFTYPSTDQGLEALLGQPSGSPEAKNWKGPYLKKAARDPWGNEYAYLNDGSGGYEIISYGADGREGGEDNNADISSANLE